MGPNGGGTRGRTAGGVSVERNSGGPGRRKERKRKIKS